MKLIVVVTRGLRPSATGPYGSSWVSTPCLDGLAAEGVVFDRHFADAADPAGARRAWRSGRYHLPLPAGAPEAPPGDEPDLLASLRARGVHTRLIVDASRPAPAEFEAGWDEVARAQPSAEHSGLETALQLTDAALKRLARRDDWLLWLDLATLLPPWDVPEEFREPYFTTEEPEDEEAEDEEEEEEPEDEDGPLTPVEGVPDEVIDPDDDELFLRLQTSYAAAVSYLDAGIGQLLESLAERRLTDEVALLLTSDLGLALGEHGVVGAGRPLLHEEVLHLPLILRLPGGAERGRRVEALTQAVDLAPTVAGLFGAALPGAHGHDLLPLARGQGPAVRPYACAGRRDGEGVGWALRTPEWAFLLPVQGSGDARAPRLYVKPDDRWEVNDVLQHHLEFADRLGETLRGFVAATAAPGPLQVPPLPDETGASPAEQG
jgi:arylsulfatase A-like enzyme